MRRQYLAACVGLVAIASFSSKAALVTVPGYADPWLAGMPDGSGASFGDIAPHHSPVLAAICVVEGALITWSATGLAGHPDTYPDQTGPDGSPGSVFSHGPGAENGISDVISPINALLGVFLGPSLPDLTPAPGTLDFFSAASRDYTMLSPLLKQVFFMGDGVTSGNLAQTIVAPAGATRLFLGTMDGFGWFNNIGEIEVDITSDCDNHVPDSGSALPLLATALASLAGVIRRCRCQFSE